jgi:hypothetical protein
MRVGEVPVSIALELVAVAYLMTSPLRQDKTVVAALRRQSDTQSPPFKTDTDHMLHVLPGRILWQSSKVVVK